MVDDWAQRSLAPRCPFTGPFIDKKGKVHWEQCASFTGHRYDHHWGRIYAPNTYGESSVVLAAIKAQAEYGWSDTETLSVIVRQTPDKH